MKKVAGIFLVCAALVLSACDKNGVVSTTYNITPWLQFESGGEQFRALNAKAYVYYGDTTYWSVASWEDAMQGIVTSKEDGRKLEPVFDAVPDENYRMSMGPLRQEELMLLVCYTEPEDVDGARMYAWRNASIIEDLSEVYVDVTFKPWRESAYYSDARWTMYNDKWITEPEPDLGGGE